MPEATDPAPAETPASRLGMRARRDTLPDFPPNRWAIIVGISRYLHEPWNLAYADKDAEALYELIIDPKFGGYEPERIRKLLNEEATTGEITRALRGFLQDAEPEDLVLIYFACHGGPDPKRPENVYLYTHDTDPFNFAGTALPMREINLSLQENLRAKRVVLLADTCHSGAIPGRRAANNSAVVTEYLTQLSKSQEASLSLLTSASASETAAEGPQWGGGHGVFTYHLIEGMKGAADRGPDKNGIVTVGKLFDYVCAQVKHDTGSNQNPIIGPDLDRDLPVAITGERDAQDYFKLAQSVFGLGRVLDDAGRYRSALRLLDQALEFALPKRHFPLAHLFRGRTLVSLADYDAALAALQMALKQDKTLHEAHFYRGIIYLKQQQELQARSAFETYLRLVNPLENELTAWARVFIDSSAVIRQGSQHYALLIGIDQYQHDSFPDLAGCVNDVEIIAGALQSFEQVQIEITTLTGPAATRDGIAAALSELGQKVTLNTTVFVHYSGQTTVNNRQEGLLIPYDAEPEGDTIKNAIRAKALVRLLEQIPAKYKIVFLDSDPHFSDLEEIATRVPNISLFIGTSPGQHAFETRANDKTYGIFSYALAQQLPQLAAQPRPTFAQIIPSVVALVSQQQRQTPRFFGEANQPLFSDEDYYLSLFEFTQRRTFGAFDLTVIRNLLAHVGQLPANFPKLTYQLGRALLEKADYATTVTTLEKALEQSEGPAALERLFTLAHAQFGAGHNKAALELLRRYAASVESASERREAETLIDLIQSYLGGPVALLVGLERYPAAETPPLPGVEADLDRVKQQLIERFGFHEEKITVLANEAATRQAIETALADLLVEAAEVPALFYFAGYGSVTPDDRPTLVCADSRRPGIFDLTLEELAAGANRQPAHLVSIVDAGWTVGHPRGLMPDSRTRPTGRGLKLAAEPVEAAVVPLQERDLKGQSLRLGQVALYDRSIKFDYGFKLAGASDATPAEAAPPVESLTTCLLRRLDQTPPEQLTYQRLARDPDEEPGQSQTAEEAFLLADQPEQPVSFAPDDLRQKILQTFRHFELTPLLDEALELLRRVIDQQAGNAPEERLHLGLAHMLLGNYNKATTSLEAAIDQHPGEVYPAANYYLGRTLVEQEKDLGRAVELLRLASQHEPDNIAVYYYLGQALRMLVEQEILGEAEQALQTYLDQGAPLDHRAEVYAFLEKRRAGGS